MMVNIENTRKDVQKRFMDKYDLWAWLNIFAQIVYIGVSLKNIYYTTQQDICKYVTWKMHNFIS